MVKIDTHHLWLSLILKTAWNNSLESVTRTVNFQFGDDANFEQLMVSMLDERDKLVDSLKNEQDKTADLEMKTKELEKERDSLRRQLDQSLPQVSYYTMKD